MLPRIIYYDIYCQYYIGCDRNLAMGIMYRARSTANYGL